jgi:hypothetical protein
VHVRKQAAQSEAQNGEVQTVHAVDPFHEVLIQNLLRGFTVS